MTDKSLIQRPLRGLLTGLALAVAAISVPVVGGALTPAYAQPAQAPEDMQAALDAYGVWRPHPRYGEVWQPAGVPRDWRPYEYGHWVYTDEWGWYWISDDVEEDWGWVTYHYGRWVHDRGAWFWVPGDEWAPAWVDWRYGDDYIGWAALPPDDIIDSYDAEPAYWVFVPSRYVTAPRLRTFIVPRERRVLALRSTRLVNRTVAVQGARLAVNPGISPAFVAAVTRTALPSYRVRPRVFGATQGVSGAVQVKREDLRIKGQPRTAARPHVNAISVQRTTTLIQPAATAPKPEALSKGAAGHLGTHPPRAAQGAAAPQQQQQQAPAPVPAPSSGPPPRSGAAPVTKPATPPPPPPPARNTPAPAVVPAVPPTPPPAVGAPARQEPPRPAPREERRDQPRPGIGAPAAKPGEPPPQAKPERPIAPQTPPPPPPAQLQQRQAPPPPPVTRPAPPSQPVAPPSPPPARVAPPPPPPPAAKPAAPPAKPATPPLKPGEKPPEPPK